MLTLIIEFIKIGLFSIGGGLATIPFLVKLGEHYHYFTNDELLKIIAISESTPGAIGINMSTFVGLKVHGIIGGVVSTLSLIFPSIIIILLIAKIMDKFKENANWKNALKALIPTSVALIAFAVLPITFEMIVSSDYYEVLTNTLIIAFVIFIIRKFKKIHPAYLVLFSVLIGICLDKFI